MDRALSLPVYREGYSNPWSPWNLMAYDPLSVRSSLFEPFARQDPFCQIERQMNSAMRDLDLLFPFHQPGQFRPGVEPSALAPVNDGITYKLQVDAKDFQPNEITVKTIKRQGRDFLIVEGKHETSDKEGYHSVQHFRRQYMVPDNVDPEKFTSKLTADGTLKVEAPVKQQAIGEGDGRQIPIQQIKD